MRQLLEMERETGRWHAKLLRQYAWRESSRTSNDKRPKDLKANGLGQGGQSLNDGFSSMIQ